MSSELSQNIKYFLSQSGVSVNELEKRAGLKQSAIHNILYGRSKNPTLDTILAIAHELGCTVEELAYFKKADISKGKSLDEEQANKVSFNQKLFSETSAYVITTISNLEEAKNLKFKSVIDTISEIYNYSYLNDKNKNLDKKFADWFIGKKIHDKNNH